MGTLAISLPLYFQILGSSATVRILRSFVTWSSVTHFECHLSLFATADGRRSYDPIPVCNGSSFCRIGYCCLKNEALSAHYLVWICKFPYSSHFIPFRASSYTFFFDSLLSSNCLTVRWSFLVYMTVVDDRGHRSNDHCAHQLRTNL